MAFKTAIMGVTGAVGQELLKILEERDFPLSSLKVLASARSKGKKVTFKGEQLTVEELTFNAPAHIEVLTIHRPCTHSQITTKVTIRVEITNVVAGSGHDPELLTLIKLLPLSEGSG